MEAKTELVSMSHGSGGKLTGRLIREVFISRFGMAEPLTDSAVVDYEEQRLAFTTDSYVIDPVFFPGGNIGKLAVCGTINDLAVSGAIPKYISAAFIIEEGFHIDSLKLIADSMAFEAEKAGVKIITGDTKVVEKGKCDSIFISTSGIGILPADRVHIGAASRVKPGDKLIINGPVGNHSIAVLGARKDLGFVSAVESDCASLNILTGKILNECREIHFMRDLTRGGLVTVLCELAGMCGNGILINESCIPVDEAVKGICEILGFDPLSLANEGKVLIVVKKDECEKVLKIMRKDPAGFSASEIGEIIADKENKVILKTQIGGERLLIMPTGIQLPRIC